MPSQLKIKLLQNFINSVGYRTNRRLVLIESDDWGSIRTPNKIILEKLKAKNYPVNNCIFTSYDSLERDSDLIALFEVLDLFKDINNNPPVITANNIVANPDFEKIKSDGFNKYHYEIFTETAKKYPNCENLISLYKTGIDNKLFIPQFHGREHVNVLRWLNDLKSGIEHTNLSFNYKMFSFHFKNDIKCKEAYLDAFGLDELSHLNYIENIIIDGLNIFNKLWGFKSDSIIAPCYIWSPELERVMFDNGVKVIQGMFAQNSFDLRNNKYKRIYHYIGQTNKKFKTTYSVRNVIFEPTSNFNIDWVNKSLYEINNAFMWGKPAIISSHRVNYIGRINEKVRDSNLKLLRELIKAIQMKWPNVEFISTKDLVKILCVD